MCTSDAELGQSYSHHEIYCIYMYFWICDSSESTFAVIYIVKTGMGIILCSF